MYFCGMNCFCRVALSVAAAFCCVFVMSQDCTFMTYNVENLFDTRHDSLRDDREFLPSSERRWTNRRFYEKVHEVMQVVVAAGGLTGPPDIVGLCEIENDFVLKTMTAYEPYDRLGYDYVHYEGPDARGIDVALLYRREFFTPIISRPVPVVLPNGNRGRDLLYVMGTTPCGVQLHLVQLHFPSRREGAEVSRPNRVAAAMAVNGLIDSIRSLDREAAIVVMGDFNDNPSDFVLTDVLYAQPYNSDRFLPDRLYNLCYDGSSYTNRSRGTYFHAGEWDMLDQIIVSGSLLDGSLPITLSAPARIFSPRWITRYDKRNHTAVPYRTYLGPHYSGGVSDHFPLLVTSK